MKDQESSAPAPKLPPSVERELELRRASVKTSDVLEAFKGKIKDEPDGRHFTVDISAQKDRMLYREMRKQYREKVIEHQHKSSALMGTVTARAPDGSVREINALLEPTLGKKGFRAGPMRMRGWRMGVIRGGEYINLDGTEYDPYKPLRTWAEIEAEKSNA